MSHFLTLVLTESGEHDEVEQLLAPYDENDEWFADGSRWDWWVIGGRWSKWLDGENIRPVVEIEPDTWPSPPFALVTPDGQWHEKARMGWFAMTTEDEDGHDEKPEAVWAATVQALLEQHPDATAVVVDCHV